MAYAALLSLSQTLDQILIRKVLFQKEKLVSLRTNVSALQTFLEDYWHKCSRVVNPLENRIIDAAYQVEDIVEYQIDDYEGSLVKRKLLFCISICNQENSASLQDVLQEFDRILVDANEIINKNPTENVSLTDTPSTSTDTSSGINTVVLKDDFMVIKQRIYNRSCNFQVIPIVGMGGIGKTTLARRLYEDSIKQGHFDRCIWIVVSQDYSLQKLLSEIILSIGKPETGDLRQVIYQELFGRRYLVVVDDLWSEKAWDDLNLILPKDTAGSRVLVTTRLYKVASYVGSSSNPPHEIQLMNEYQSWMLFEERVFGKGFPCLSELKKTGKKLVKGCRGLPLTIVVIAGLLKGKTSKEYWDAISKNISSSEPTIALHCSKVLSLSYNHLPLHLRPCFLYVTMFPEDYEIKANRLIRLWMAEGFVKPDGSKLLEEVAEGYLHDLVGRSLLMVSKKAKCSDRIKTIRIHDVLRDFGISNSQQERFHHHRDLRPEYRRVTIYGRDALPLLVNFHKPATRSVLIPYRLSGVDSYGKLRLLKVFDACYTDINRGATIPVHLRYISVSTLDYTVLKSISKLRNIQTLNVDRRMEGLIIPLKVWKRPSLRHLIFSSYCRLEQPSEDNIFEETNLQTIRSVVNLRLTKKVLEMLGNLRKLKVCYESQRIKLLWKSRYVYDYDLVNLIHLQKLEKLAISFSGGSLPLSDLAFPKSLKKLSLGSIQGPWKDMSVVGSLPNLEVFNLISFYPNKGEGWEPTEGQFLKLKHLKFECVLLDHWEAESVHFPSLEMLVLEFMLGALNEIPSGIGEIDTLKVIKLAMCGNSVVDSAKQIQADQWEMGNEDLQLFVSASDYGKDAKYKEIRPEKH